MTGWIYEFAADLAAAETPPVVVSISWGFTETSQCHDQFGPDMPANCSKLGPGTDSRAYVARAHRARG